MQLRDIQYVVTIAEKKSFSRAAESLYTSQPALSQAVKRLETELGIGLFARKRGKVTLTKAGELFVQDGQQILNLSSHIVRQMEDVQTLKQGSLHIGMTPLFGRFYFAETYHVFHQLYPGVSITIWEESSSTLENLVTSGKVDLALLPLPLTDESLTFEQVVSEETFLAVPADHRINKLMPRPAAGEFGRVDMEFFRDDDFILLFPGQRLRSLGMEACRAAGFEPRVVFETHYIDAANALVAAGVGISFVPYMIFTTRADNGGAVYYHINGINATRNLVAAYGKDGQLPHAAREFIRILRELMR